MSDQDENPTRPSIKAIIRSWKFHCGENRVSDRGTSFVTIPTDRRPHFLNLIQTLIDYGYNETEIRTGRTSSEVGIACWDDRVRKYTPQQLRKKRLEEQAKFDDALDEYFRLDISMYKRPEKIKISAAPHVPKKVVADELAEAQGDIVIGTYSEFEDDDPELDKDFLNDLSEFKRAVREKT